MKIYEVLFILPESMKEDSVEAVITSIKRELEGLGAVVSTVTRLGRKSFAREMNKQQSGFYVVMNANMEPAKAQTIPGHFKLNEDVFRLQVVKVDEAQEAAAGA